MTVGAGIITAGKSTVRLQFRFKAHLCCKVRGNLLVADSRWDYAVALKASRTLCWSKPFWGRVFTEPYAVIFFRAKQYITPPDGRKTVSNWDTMQDTRQ